MKITCPACGAVSSLDGLLQHDAARAAMATAYALSAPLGVGLLRYMALFRPAQRSLTWDRVAALTEELLPMIQTSRITRNRREYAVTHETWCLAFEQILSQRDKLVLPLKGHGYLLEVLAGMADKAANAQQAHAEAIRRGETPIGGSAAHKAYNPNASTPSPLRGEGGGEGEMPAAPQNRANPETIAAAIATAKTITGAKS